MPALHDHVQPNCDEVVSKVMDGEAIIIRLRDGVYYSMDRVGGVVWQLIESNRSMREIVAAVTALYDVGASQAQTDIERLMEELLSERLITISSGEAAALDRDGTASSAKQPYEPPQLNVYRDMGDLLALDPPAPSLKDIPWKKAGEEPVS